MRQVVMVPGLVSDADVFAPQVQALSDVATASVADITGAPTIAAMAEAVLTSAPARFALAGHSMGGYVAPEVMRRAPERVDALGPARHQRTSGDGSADGPPPSAARAVGRAGLAALLDALWPFEVAPSRVADAALRRRMDAMMVRTGPDVFARQTDAIIGRPDSRPHSL